MKFFIQPHHVKALKRLVLAKAEIKHISAADCLSLSIDISAKTGLPLSESTLKRLFGFAKTTYIPRKYTLDILAQFVEYTGWDQFVEFIITQEKPRNLDFLWTRLTRHAHRISENSIRTNVVSSGVPQHLWTERRPVSLYLRKFLETDKTACLLVGPSGIGKTIGLTQWALQQLNRTQKRKQRDICLLLNNCMVYQAASSIDIPQWLSFLLNLSSSQEIELILKRYKRQAPGRLYLVIDDLDHDMTHKRLFSIVFKHLLQLISQLACYPWIRVVLSLRWPTWQKYQTYIQDTQEAFSCWHSGPWLDLEDGPSHLPGLNHQELQRLICKTNKKYEIFSEKHDLLQSILQTPLFFHYYLQLQNGVVDLKNWSHADEFAIAFQYLNKKVFKGIDAVDKRVMLESLIQHLRFDGQILYIKRAEVSYLLKNNYAIYYELLQSGILYEHRSGTEAFYYIQIRFRSVIFASYFLSQQWLDQGKESEKITMMGALSPYLSIPEIQLIWLKWLIIHSFRENQMDRLHHIWKNQTTQHCLPKLMHFACSSLKYIHTVYQHPTNDASTTSVLIAFTDLVLAHSMWGPSYALCLKEMLQHPLSQQEKVHIYIFLAFFYLQTSQEQEAIPYINLLCTLPEPIIRSYPALWATAFRYLRDFHRFKILSKEDMEDFFSKNLSENHDQSMTYKQLIYLSKYIYLKTCGTETELAIFHQTVSMYLLK